MSAEQPLNISQHLTLIRTITEQYSQIVESFDSRLNSLENSIKSCEFLVNQQQKTHSQLIQRIESLENNTNKSSRSRSLIASIQETQYEENNSNNKNEHTLQDLNGNINHSNKAMPILEPGTEIEKENLSPTLVDDVVDDIDHNTLLQPEPAPICIDYEVLFSSFESITRLAQTAMQQNEFKTALRHFDDAFGELNKYIDYEQNIENIPSNKKQTVSVSYCNQAICYGKLQTYNHGLLAINKCVLITPNWNKAYSTMGALYAYMENCEDEAINAYKKALQLIQKNGVDIGRKNKIQSRLEIVLDRRNNYNTNNNYNKRRKMSNISLNESPAKRVKYNNNNPR